MTYDVVIVGGSVMGSAIAYYLASNDDFDGEILVVEKDPSYTKSSTALSAASIRQQFSTPLNIEMSRYGSAFLQTLDEHLSVDGVAPAIEFVQGGYLFLATEEGKGILEQNHSLQRSLQVNVVLFSPSELQNRFPWLKVHDLGAGSLGLTDEGWFDAYGLMQGFRRKAKALGVTFLDDEVVGFDRAGSRIHAVHLREGGAVSCAQVVNASGASAAKVALLAGCALPVHSRKRSVYVFQCRDSLPGCPLVVDPSGLYFRPEGQGVFITGMSPPADEDHDCEDFEVDYEFFEDELWPRLYNRVEAFSAIKLQRAWSGHYAYNIHDQNAILGPHPDCPNFILANGFSGHGLQQAPAVGRGVSEWLTYGSYRSLDLAAFCYERFAAKQWVRELNVI